MTDDPSESDGGTPSGAAPKPDPADGDAQAPVRAFGRRPDFAGAATVLSHNFRAPIVPEPHAPGVAPSPAPTDKLESLQAGNIAAGAANDAAADGPDTVEEHQSPAEECDAEAVEETTQEHCVEVEHAIPADAAQIPQAADESAEVPGTESGPDICLDAAPGDAVGAAADTAADPLPDPIEEPAPDDLLDVVEDGTGEDAIGATSSVEEDLDGADGPAEPEPIAGSLLEVPVRGGPEAHAEGGDAPDSSQEVESRKREIHFDGTDEPLGPAEASEAEPAAFESPEREPGDVAPPPDEAELARKLGISFRDGEAASAELELQQSREEAELARKLGIQFRDDEAGVAAEGEGDELSEAARRLGISFRDPEDARPVKKKASMTGRLIMLFTLFSGLAGILMLLFFGESLFEAVFG